MTEHLGQLIAGTLAFGAILAGIAGLVRGPEAAMLVVPAGLLCLVPACLSLMGTLWAARRSPEGQLAAFLGGTMFRLVCVLGGGAALYLRVESLRQPLLWIWIILFYLFTLMLETWLVLARTRTHDPAR